LELGTRSSLLGCTSTGGFMELRQQSTRKKIKVSNAINHYNCCKKKKIIINTKPVQRTIENI
jgi:hypothetical protein